MSDCTDSEQKDEIFEWQGSQNEFLASDRSSVAGDVFSANKGSNIPIARVKKIMKEGEHPGMIAADAPVLLAKACEMLIKDLTLQSWDCTLTTRRCTLQRQDVASAIFKNNVYNFMLDIFTPEELYPKLEPKMEAVPQLNAVKRMKEGRNYSVLHSNPKPRDGYIRGNVALGPGQTPMGPALYQRGAQRYIINPVAQGPGMSSRTPQMIQCHSIPRVNTIMHYSKNLSSNGHMQNGHITKVPMQVLQHANKSHPIVQGTVTYADGSMQSGVQTGQQLQPQVTYLQRVATPQEHNSSQTYQQPF
ncbi:nuclear transcription factor Y subunit C-2 [Babesia caballi]|uniref:Nuclear transcription factor Y subunit C-2 n=1 Tax=Babesia caballi TaxID=5871 RepID=A0AAV4LWV8_BABCB|nr:nuclear transcription factor Y subunit C-2 [Babesia caballi]